MRICHITTFWPNRLGLTHYTDALINGIQANLPEKHFIAAEFPADESDNEKHHCVPCFRRDEDYVPGIMRTVKSMHADVVLIQYANDIFGDDNRLPRLLQCLKGEGIPSVVLCHSIYPGKRRTRYKPGGNAATLDRAMAQYASCMLVHSKRMKMDLLDRGVAAEKVVVIPHGTLAMPEQDRTESRKALEIPVDAKLVLFFGFIWLGKGVDFLLGAFAELTRRVPNAFLYIGGYTRHKYFYSQMYMAYLRARIRGLGIANHTKLWGDYVPDEMVPTMFSAADLVAFPYRQDYSSVSGVVHQAAGMDKLMLCSRISKFDEVGESISPELLVGAQDKHAWVNQMTRLLTEDTWAEEIRAKTRQFAEQTCWEEIGRRHLELYKVLLDGKPAASAPFASAA